MRRLLRMCERAFGATPSTMAVVLSAVGLTKRFGELTAVSDLSFELEAGSVTGFLGPNGAGKTTTLRMVLGLAAPTGGHTLVFGHPFVELEHPGNRVGAVLEAADLHPGRTGRDHLRVLAPAARVPASRVDDVLALVDPTGRSKPACGGLLARHASAPRARSRAAR
jgi:ABC-2 type transport system ATP-binding protein